MADGGVTFAEQKGPSKDTENPQDDDKKYRASSAVTLKTRSAWDEAKLNPWYSPRFWLDLLIHPSVEFKMNHVRRRARLFALVALCFLVTSIISNSIAYVDGRDSTMLGFQLLSNLLMLIAYALSRTKFATSGKSLGVFAVWLLPYLSTIMNLQRETNSSGDATVTDSISWLYSPAWYLMAAIFLSRSMTKFVLVMDAASLMFLPVIAGSTFYHIRKLLFFHMVNGSLLLLASIIAFRDKLQLYSQHDGQVHEDQHRAGTISRFLLQPHKDITDRIFRRRARILSAFLLGLIPFSIIWTGMEASGWVEGVYDPVVVAVSTAVIVASCILYFLSRTQYTRWASRWTIFMLLLLPYLYGQGSTTTMDGEMYANLITTTAASILGVTLLSGPELVALSGIIFFFNLYSPVFPPHIIASLILLGASLVYRRDIKEIHDTAFHRDDLYEDDSGDLLIPWEKRYLFGSLSYIQMVIGLYVLTFGAMFILGLTALIAAATTTVVATPVTTVTLTAVGESPTHILYVHTKDCSALTPQTYIVTGEKAKFTYVSPYALKANSTNTIQLTVTAKIGPVTEVGFALGDGNYYITQHDSCIVDSIEIWDNVQEKAYSTDIYDPSATSPSRRLLDSSQPFGNDNFDASDYYYTGLGAVQLREKYRTASCTVLKFPIARGNFNWYLISCSCSEAAFLSSALACYNVGGCDSDQGCCSGHGTCVASQAKLNPIPGCSAAKKYCVFCLCDLFYGGITCGIPAAASCGIQNVSDPAFNDPDLSRYAYNGVCNQLPPVDFEDGATGDTLKRVVPADYLDGVSTVIDNPVKVQGKLRVPTTPQPADVIAASLVSNNPGSANIDFLNMFGVGVYEAAMADLVGLDLDPTDKYIYTSAANPPKFTRAENMFNTGTTWAGAPADGNPVKVPTQYPNDETAWIDLSYIYTTYRTPLYYRKNDKSFLDETKILPGIGGSVEFQTVTTMYIRYHNILAKSFELYYCGVSPVTTNKVVKNCTLRTQYNVNDVNEMIFEMSRTGTIYFVQHLIEASLLPSFFPFGSLVDPLDPLLLSDLNYPTDGVAQQYLASAVEVMFSLRSDTSGVNAAPPILSIPACSPAQSNITLDQFQTRTLNLLNTPAKNFGSDILPVWTAALTDNIERARDLGLGRYIQYYQNLKQLDPNLTPGTVSAAELIPGVQKETNFYSSNVNGGDYFANYPPVALALTIAQIHKSILADRLGIHNVGGGVPTVLQKYFDMNNPTQCFQNGSGCTSDSAFAWAVLVGPAGQYIYDPNVPGQVPALLFSNYFNTFSSQTQTLFAVQATLFYAFTQRTIPFPPFNGNPDYFDQGYTSCVPSVPTRTFFGEGYASGPSACGCCRADPNYGFCF